MPPRATATPAWAATANVAATSSPNTGTAGQGEIEYFSASSVPVALRMNAITPSAMGAAQARRSVPPRRSQLAARSGAAAAKPAQVAVSQITAEPRQPKNLHTSGATSP